MESIIKTWLLINLFKFQEWKLTIKDFLLTYSFFGWRHLSQQIQKTWMIRVSSMSAKHIISILNLFSWCLWKTVRCKERIKRPMRSMTIKLISTLAYSSWFSLTIVFFQRRFYRTSDCRKVKKNICDELY